MTTRQAWFKIRAAFLSRAHSKTTIEDFSICSAGLCNAVRNLWWNGFIDSSQREEMRDCIKAHAPKGKSVLDPYFPLNSSGALKRVKLINRILSETKTRRKTAK